MIGREDGVRSLDQSVLSWGKPLLYLNQSNVTEHWPWAKVVPTLLWSFSEHSSKVKFACRRFWDFPLQLETNENFFLTDSTLLIEMFTWVE